MSGQRGNSKSRAHEVATVFKDLRLSKWPQLCLRKKNTATFVNTLKMKKICPYLRNGNYHPNHHEKPWLKSSTSPWTVLMHYSSILTWLFPSSNKNWQKKNITRIKCNIQRKTSTVQHHLEFPVSTSWSSKNKRFDVWKAFVVKWFRK